MLNVRVHRVRLRVKPHLLFFQQDLPPLRTPRKLEISCWQNSKRALKCFKKNLQINVEKNHTKYESGLYLFYVFNPQNLPSSSFASLLVLITLHIVWQNKTQ